VYNDPKLVDIEDYVKANFKDEPVVFVVGAFAHGGSFRKVLSVFTFFFFLGELCRKN
jgi:hypothetical protein